MKRSSSKSNVHRIARNARKKKRMGGSKKNDHDMWMLCCIYFWKHVIYIFFKISFAFEDSLLRTFAA